MKRNLRKLLSAVCCLAMLMTMLPVFTASAADEVFFQDDFSKYATGTFDAAANGYKYTKASGTPAVTIEAEGGNQYLKIAAQRPWLEMGTPTGTYTMQFDVRRDKASSGLLELWMGAQPGGQTIRFRIHENGAIAFLDTATSKNYFLLNDGGFSNGGYNDNRKDEANAILAANTWYHVEFLADAGANTIKLTVSEVGGTAVYKAERTMPDFDNFTLRIDGQDFSGSTIAVSIDNIKVVSGAVEATLPEAPKQEEGEAISGGALGNFADAAEPAVSEDFESYDAGAVYRDGPFSDSDLPAGAQVSKQVQAEQGGRFLRMSAANTAASDGTARVRMRTTKNFSDKFTVQWDYRTPDTSFAQLDIYLRQGGNVRARVTKKGTVDLLVLDAAKVAGKMESVYGTQPMKAGRWYTFKVQADEKQLVLEVYEKGADMALETHTIGQDAATLTKLFDPYAIWFDLWGRSDRTDTSAAAVDLDEIYITEGHYQGLKKTEDAGTSVVDGWDSLVLRSGGGSMKVDNLTLKTQSGGETVIRERFDTYSPGGVPAGWTVDNAPAAVAGEDGSKATLASAYGGLYASVLGDSISTYAGWSNDATRNSTTAGNLVSYPREDSGFDVNGTWWMQAVRGAGMELLVNNSYSGDELNPDEDPGIGLKRCMQLHDDRGRQPDVLLIYFGTNDAGAHKRHTDNLDLLRVNYARMMENIAATYPKAQVFYFTLLPRTEFDCLPYSALIRELVTGSGNPNFHLVDLQKDSGITLNNLKEHTVDNLHPNAKGMDAIAATVLKALEAAAGDKAAQGNGNTLELSADGQIRYKADVPSKGCELSVDVRFDRFGGSVGLYKGNRAMVSLRVAPGKNGTGMLQYFNGSWTDTGVTMEKGRWYNLCLEKSPRRATVNLWLDRKQVLSLDYATMTDSHSCAAAAMTDVANDTWYHSAVDYALTHQLMSGFDANTFGPEATLTRAQVVQILYNKEGQPALNGQTHAFSDVPTSQWYNNAVTWASARGVVSGYGGGIFKPDDPVSLEQVFVILWNYMGNPPLTGDADAMGPHSEWAGNAIGWAQASGVINGVPFQRVTDPANRAQTAQVMMNLLDN